VERELRLQVALLDQLLEAGRTDFDDGEFGCDKEGVDQNEQGGHRQVTQ
jgi:hypothetical protein